MAGALDDGKYTTMSSLSIVASRATLVAQDIVATSTLSAPSVALTGPVRVADGSAINPQIGFTSENSLGFYRSAASKLAVSYGEFVVGDGSAILPSIGVASENSLGLYRSGASKLAMSYGEFAVVDGSAILPGLGFASENSLGFFRSGNSVAALSYGHLRAAISYSGLTTSTSATTANQTVQGSFRVSVLSLTSNGAEIAVLSGNTTYKFASVAVG